MRPMKLGEPPIPKIVCMKCGVEYRCVKSGAVAIDMFLDPPQPYKITNCDAWECPGCGARVLAGFAGEGTAHYEKNFKDVLDTVLSSDAHARGFVVKVFEHPGFHPGQWGDGSEGK